MEPGFCYGCRRKADNHKSNVWELLMDKETEQLILKKLQLDYLSLHAILTDVEKIVSALVVDLDPRVNEIQRIQGQMKEYLRGY